MKKVLIAGGGKIGSLIGCLLSASGDYAVHIADVDTTGPDLARVLAIMPEISTVELDLTQQRAIKTYIKKHGIVAVIVCLPYYIQVSVAKVAKDCQIHYFNLTEDVTTSSAIREIAQGAKSAFVPQCGLAPGFISIVANNLMQRFTSIEAAKLRVGALPQRVNNSLQYALTWSTDGLINEYGNQCHAVIDGEDVIVRPLEGLESIQIDGMCYEAFNTSGGIGTLAQTYKNKATNIDYKTMRYPGHCEKMRVLMNDLKLNQDRGTLKAILENAIPKTYQDLVLVYVSVSGEQTGGYIEENYMKKIYPKVIAGLNWSAIQVTTAAGVSAVFDIVLNNQPNYQGLVLQERISLDQFLENQFGAYYR